MATMALTADGNLYARFFIELGPMEIEITPNPPVPAPTGSTTYDTFDYYDISSSLAWKNSGSNEWNNKTALASWVARLTWTGIQEWDDFTTYTVSASLSASLAGSGSGAWSGVYDWVGRYTYFGIKLWSSLSEAQTSSYVNGQTGGYRYDDLPWSESWVGRSNWFGIKAYDDMSTYTPPDPINGGNAQPNPLYQDFNGAWRGANTVSASS